MSLPSHVDVLVIGGGHAGLCAAITAAEAGAKVTLLESAPRLMRGGNTRHTRNLRAMHAEPVAGLEGAYDAHEYFDDIMRVTAGHTDESLTQMVIEHSEPLLHWLQAHGVHFQPSLSGTLNLSRTNAFFLGGGCALLNALYISAEQAGVQIHYNCEVQDFVFAGATIKQVMVKQDNTRQAVEPKSVIAACGGFQANAAWMRSAWGPAADNFLIRGTPFNQGHVLRALMDNNVATVGDPTQCHAVAIDARAPKYDGGIVSRLDCVPFSVVVNQAGQRFYDEGEDFWPKRYAIWGRLVAQQPDQTAYAVIDAKVEDNFMPSLFPPFKAENLDALAKQVNLPANALNATIAAFNQAVQPGQYDPNLLDGCATHGLTPNKTHWALAIDTPPFSAYPLRPGITFTYLGLKVDKQARVYKTDGQVCANLYAAGEIMAGNILGQGYCAGTGMTIGGVYGRIAGAQAACQLNSN